MKHDKKSANSKYVSLLSPAQLSYNIRTHIFNTEISNEEKMHRIDNLINGCVVEEDYNPNQTREIKNKSDNDVDTIVDILAINSILLIVRYDDVGQTYFIEHAKNNEIESINCGSYNTDYKYVAEYKFGSPLLCEYYANQVEGEDCAHKECKGYCCRCPYNDRKEYLRKELISLGIMDKRGNISTEFSCLLKSKEEDY